MKVREALCKSKNFFIVEYQRTNGLGKGGNGQNKGNSSIEMKEYCDRMDREKQLKIQRVQIMDKCITEAMELQKSI